MAKMTKDEATALRRIARDRGKLSVKAIEARAAQVIAEGERQIARVYRIDDKRWEQLMAPLLAAERKTSQLLAQVCEEEGIPPTFRPWFTIDWHGRGENAFKERRAELIRVLHSTVKSSVEAATLQVNLTIQDVIEKISTNGLETDQAHEFLAAMPSIEELVPMVDVKAMKAPVKSLQSYLDYVPGYGQPDRDD